MFVGSLVGGSPLVMLCSVVDVCGFSSNIVFCCIGGSPLVMLCSVVASHRSCSNTVICVGLLITLFSAIEVVGPLIKLYPVVVSNAVTCCRRVWVLK